MKLPNLMRLLKVARDSIVARWRCGPGSDHVENTPRAESSDPAALACYRSCAADADSAAMEAYEARDSARDIEAVYLAERNRFGARHEGGGYGRIVVSDAHARAEIYKAYASDMALQADAAHAAVLAGSCYSPGAERNGSVRALHLEGRPTSIWFRELSEVLGFLLPCSIRRSAYEPYLEELRVDLLRSARPESGWADWLVRSCRFGCRVTLALLSCFWLVLRAGVSTVANLWLRSRGWAWFRDFFRR